MPPRPASRLAVAAFAVIVAGFASLCGADANSEFEQRRDEEHRNSDAMIGSLPSLGERPMGGLLQVSLENKALVVRTPLPNSEGDGYLRCKVTDLGLTALIRVAGIPATAPSPAKPVVLQFNCTDYRKPLQIITLAITSQPSALTINKSTQFPKGGYGNILLTQQPSDMSPGGGSVQLTVNEASREGVAGVNIAVGAADFFTFVCLYPHETDAYIRPLLHDFGQESVFAPDPLIAAQVFDEIWVADPVATRQVQALLPALDQDDFRDRGRALRDLQKLGRAGAGVLMHLDRRTLTPEQNARVDLALAPFPQVSVKEALRLRGDPVFLLDCLYGDDEKLRKVALDRLRQITDPSIEFDLAATPAARAAAIAALRQRLLGGPSREPTPAPR